MNKQRLVSTMTLSGVAAAVLAIGGCDSGPEQIEGRTAAADHGGHDAVALDDTASEEVGGSGVTMAENDGSQDPISEGDASSDTEAETEVPVAETGADVVEVELVEVDAAEADVVEVEVVEVDDTEADVVEAEVIAEDVPVEPAAPKVSGPMPEGDFTVTFAADDPELGSKLLQTLALGDGADSYEATLAAGTVERVRTAAAEGDAFGSVHLHRLHLSSDQVMPIESAVAGAEVLLAVAAPKSPRIIGSGNAGTSVWKGVRAFQSRSERPLLIWDRLAERDGWSGWFVVLTR